MRRDKILALTVWALVMVWVCPDRALAENDPALEQYYTANALYNRKLYAAAVPEYKAFLAAQPQHLKAEQARLGLAFSCYLSGNFTEAEPQLKLLIQNRKVGDQAQLLLCLGQCQLKLRGPAEAEKTFVAATQAQGAEEFKNLSAALLTDTLFKQKKWEATAAAADNLLKAVKTGDMAMRAAYQGAYARYSLKKFNEAAKGLEAMLPLVKDSSLENQAAFLLAESRREAGEFEKAAEAYATAAKNDKDPLAVEATFRLGYVSFFLKKYDDAVKALTKSLQADPKAAFASEARYYLGRSHVEKKEFDAGRQHLREVATGASEFAASAVLWMGRSFSRQNQPAAAVQVITEFLPRVNSQQPLLGDLLFEQANALIELKKYADASQCFVRIERECPKWPDIVEVFRLNALCLHWEKKYQESLQRCEQFIAARKDKPDPAMLFLKAENIYLMNPQQTDAALKLYQDFVAAYPQDPKTDAATLRIAQIWHARGQWAEGLKAIMPLVKKAPEGKAFSQVDFLAGDCAFRLEEWDLAIARLDAFIKKSPAGEPNRDTAMIELALAGSRKNKTDTTAESLKTLIAQQGQSPHLALALAEQGKLEYETKKLREARNSMQRIVKEFPQSPQRTQAEYYLGWIALDEKRNPEAIANFEYVVSKSPGDPLAQDSLLQLGLLMLRTEKYPEALRYLVQHTQAYPKSPKADEAMYSAGLAYARNKQWDAAINCFRSLVEKFPNSALLDRGGYEWAWAERNRNNIPEAVKQYEYLLKTFPQSAMVERARFELSELTFDAKNFDKVIAQLKESIATAKEKAIKEQAMYRLAWAYLSKGDPDAAAKGFIDFVTEFPESERVASAYYQAGECRMKTKEYEAALEHFAAALKSKDPKEVRESALLRQGEAQGLVKKWEESAATYEQFQRTYPASKWIQHARFGAGWARENQKQYPQAIAEYRKVLAGKGADEITARSQFQFGECLFALGKRDEAIQELMRVDVTYKFKEWSARALLEIGRVLEAKGENSAAVAQFKEVIKRFPDHGAAVVAKERLDALRSSM
jgi:TolA-binding protein